LRQEARDLDSEEAETQVLRLRLLAGAINLRSG
jgi:hypothetical protein